MSALLPSYIKRHPEDHRILIGQSLNDLNLVVPHIAALKVEGMLCPLSLSAEERQTIDDFSAGYLSKIDPVTGLYTDTIKYKGIARETSRLKNIFRFNPTLEKVVDDIAGGNTAMADILKKIYSPYLDAFNSETGNMGLRKNGHFPRKGRPHKHGTEGYWSMTCEFQSRVGTGWFNPDNKIVHAPKETAFFFSKKFPHFSCDEPTRLTMLMDCK